MDFGGHPLIIQLECKILDIEEVLVAFTVVIVLEGIGFIIVHELLDDRIPDKRTSEFTGNDTDVAHVA